MAVCDANYNMEAASSTSKPTRVFTWNTIHLCAFTFLLHLKPSEPHLGASCSQILFFGFWFFFFGKEKKKVPTLFIVFHHPPSRDSATIRTRDGPKSHSYRCHQSRDAPTNRTFTSSLPTPPAATVTTTNNPST